MDEVRLCTILMLLVIVIIVLGYGGPKITSFFFP